MASGHHFQISLCVCVYIYIYICSFRLLLIQISRFLDVIAVVSTNLVSILLSLSYNCPQDEKTKKIILNSFAKKRNCCFLKLLESLML
jgi:hypothetical protein